jgi:outer membrane biosynthesis protein TonB
MYRKSRFMKIKIKTIAVIFAVASLALTAFCVKKEELVEPPPVPAKKAETPPVAEASVVVEEAPAAEPQEEQPVATVEVEVKADTAPAKPAPPPSRQAAVKPPPPAPAPAPPPEPAAAPAPPPPLDPKLVMEHIMGPKRVIVGHEFTFKADYSGHGLPASVVWRFKLGNEVVEKKTDQPSVTASLDKTGEWSATCELIGKSGNPITAMTIKFFVVNPDPN